MGLTNSETIGEPGWRPGWQSDYPLPPFVCQWADVTVTVFQTDERGFYRVEVERLDSVTREVDGYVCATRATAYEAATIIGVHMGFGLGGSVEALERTISRRFSFDYEQGWDAAHRGDDPETGWYMPPEWQAGYRAYLREEMTGGQDASVGW